MKTKNMTTQLKKLASAIKFSHLACAGIVAGQAVAPGAYAAPGTPTFDTEKGTIEIDGKIIDVTQTEDFFSIDWDSFNLDADEIINFLHATEGNSSFAVLNRITGNSASEIHGQINSDGHVILINPRGILFSETARVDVGAITASGLDINPDQIGADFSFGDALTLTALTENNAGGGYVINQGVINAARGAALIGRQVVNAGTAQLTAAKLASLTAADEAVLTFDADGLIGVSIQKEVMEKVLGEEYDSALLNDGSLIGAQVLMQADVSGSLFTHAVNNQGVVRATGIDTSGGSIRLTGSGGSIANSGADAEMTAPGRLDVETELSFINTGSISVDSVDIKVGTAGLGSDNNLGNFTVTSASTVTGGGGTDKFKLASSETVKVTDEKKFNLGEQLSFSSVEEVDVGNSDLDATSVVAGVELKDANTVETAGMTFSSVDSAKATKLTSNTSRTDYVITGGGSLTAGGIGFTELTSLGGAGGEVRLDALAGDIALNGDLSGYTVNGIAVSGINTLNVNSEKVVSAKLLGRQDAEDIFNVVDTGDLEIGTLRFNDITDVDANAGGASMNNTVQAGSVELLSGNNSVKASGITFSAIDDVEAATATSNISRTDYVITGGNSLTAGGVSFTELTSLGGAGGEVRLDALAGDIALNGDLSGYTVNGIAVSGINTLNVNSEKVTSAKLLGRQDAEDIFNVVDAGDLDIGTLHFNNITDVDANAEGASTNNTVQADSVELLDNNSVKTADITFTAIDAVEAGIVSSNSSRTDYVITGANKLESANIVFTGLTSLAGSGGDVDLAADILSGDIALNQDLTGYTANGIQVTGIGTLNITRDEGVPVDQWTKTALRGRGDESLEDTFNLVEENDVKIGGLQFNSITDVVGNSGTNILGNAGDIYLQGAGAANELESGGVYFKGISKVSSFDTLKASQNGDSYVITNNNRITANQIVLEQDIYYVEAGGGEDTVTGLSGNYWELVKQGSNAVENKAISSGITFENIENVQTENATLYGENIDETFKLSTVDEVNIVEANKIQFEGLSLVEGGNASDTLDASAYSGSLKLTDANRQLATDDGSPITFNGISFAKASSLVGTAGDDRFQLVNEEGDSGESEIYLDRLFSCGISTCSIRFSGLEEVDASGGDAVDAAEQVTTLTGGSREADIGGILFSNLDKVVNTNLIQGADDVGSLDTYILDYDNGTTLKANGVDFGTYRGKVDARGGDNTLKDIRGDNGDYPFSENSLQLAEDTEGNILLLARSDDNIVGGLEFAGITDVDVWKIYAGGGDYIYNVTAKNTMNISDGPSFINLEVVDGGGKGKVVSTASEQNGKIWGILFENVPNRDVGGAFIQSDWVGDLYLPGFGGRNDFVLVYTDENGSHEITYAPDSLKEVDINGANIVVRGVLSEDWTISAGDADDVTAMAESGFTYKEAGGGSVDSSVSFSNVGRLTANNAWAKLDYNADSISLEIDADYGLQLVVDGISITGMTGIDGGSLNNFLDASTLTIAGLQDLDPGADFGNHIGLLTLALANDGQNGLVLGGLEVAGLDVQNFSSVSLDSLKTVLPAPEPQPEPTPEGETPPPLPNPSLIYTVIADNSLNVGNIETDFLGLTKLTSDSAKSPDAQISVDFSTEVDPNIKLLDTEGQISGFKANGIEMAGVTKVDAGGAGVSTLTGNAATNVFTAGQVDGNGNTQVTISDFEFLNIDRLNASQGRLDLSGSYTDFTLAGEWLTIDQADLNLQVANLGKNLVGATGGVFTVEKTAAIAGDNIVTAGGFTIENIGTVNNTGTLTGTTSADSFTLDAKGLSSHGVLFNGVSAVTALGEGNSLVGSLGTGENWTLLSGSGSLKYGGIEFSGLASATGGNGILQGAGSEDKYQITEKSQLTGNGINFGHITKVLASGGAVGAAAGSQWVLGASDNIATASAITFENIDRVTGTGVILDAASVNTAIDDFTLTGQQLKLGSDSGIVFESVSRVDATSGSDNILSSLTSNADSWSLDGSSGTLTVNDVVFAGIGKASSTSNASLATTTSSGETFRLDGNNAFTVAGIGFSGIGGVVAGGTGNRLQGYSTAANTYNLTADGDISTASMLFSGISEVFSGSGVGTGADIVNADGASWTSVLADGGLKQGSAEATVNGITLVFHDLAQVNGAGTYAGQNLDSDYYLSGPDSLGIGGISYSGLTELVAGSGVDTLHGTDTGSQWSIGADGNILTTGGTQLGFSGFEALVAGSGADQFTLSGGSLDSIDTGDGNNSVRLAGTAFSKLTLGDGDNQVQVDADTDQKLSIAAGSGDNRLQFNLVGKTWNVAGGEGNATIGNFAISGFDYLDNAVGDLKLNTDQRFDFVSSTEDGVQFADSGLFLAYNGDNNVTVTSSGTGTIGGRLRAARADLTVSGDVNLETDVDALSVFTTGADIDVAILADNDLKIGQIDAGRGDIRLISDGFGSLTAENYGVTHLRGSNIQVGNEQLQWNTIGDVILPLRVDSNGAVKFVSFSYFEPEFVGSLPHFVATGDRLQSIASAQASQGLKSAAQNGLDDQAQLDEGIFTEVTPYSSGVNTVRAPELSLVGGELVPVEEDDEEERREEEPVGM